MKIELNEILTDRNKKWARIRSGFLMQVNKKNDRMNDNVAFESMDGRDILCKKKVMQGIRCYSFTRV